jgi:hypothetical protein
VDLETVQQAPITGTTTAIVTTGISTGPNGTATGGTTGVATVTR